MVEVQIFVAKCPVGGNVEMVADRIDDEISDLGSVGVCFELLHLHFEAVDIDPLGPVGAGGEEEILYSHNGKGALLFFLFGGIPGHQRIEPLFGYFQIDAMQLDIVDFQLSIEKCFEIPVDDRFIGDFFLFEA